MTDWEYLLYDFERVLEKATRAVFVAVEIKAFTTYAVPKSGDSAIDDQLETYDLQKDKPRAEIMFTPGAGQGHFKLVNSVERETCWKGQLRIDIVSEDDMRIHSALRVKVRALMHGFRELVNSVEPMQYHKVQFCADAGSTPALQIQEGELVTTMLFDIDFSVQDDAWALITT